jgi:hypothetical protein
MPNGFKIRGIAPSDLKDHPDPVRLMYWSWVSELGLAAKDRELSQGLDATGDPLRPITPATRKHRHSAMTPDGKGDPNAPPLMPGRALSRTRSLLASRSLTTHAEFYWRYYPWTGDTWAKVLTYHKNRGRDVFGMSDDAVRIVRQKALARWRAWLRDPTVPVELDGRRVLAPLGLDHGFSGQVETAGRTNLRYATLGIGVSSPSDLAAGRWSGGMTEAELKRFFRAPSPANVQGRPGQYNRLLSHTWAGGRGPFGGAVAPLTPEPPPKPPPAPLISPSVRTRVAMPQAKEKRSILSRIYRWLTGV